MAVVLVHREFYTPDGLSRAAPSAPVREPLWGEVLKAARLIGDSGAKVKIAVFDDLECPYCKRFNDVAQQVRVRYPGDVAIYFVHYPLSNHRFAQIAARVAECANTQGRFGEIVNAVYEKQDSIGIKTWDSYAHEAQVPDTLRFSKCIAATTRLEMVDRGLAVGKRIKLQGTPTVLVNGWRMQGVPSDSVLVSTVAAILNGKQPYGSAAKGVR